MIEHGRRVKFTKDTLDALVSRLEPTKALLGVDACVYATGSYGRLEASEHSDLDLFIVGLSKSTDKRDADYLESRLSRLNEICVKADLIEATRALEIPDFDGDGRYLVQYPIGELVKALGTPEDDANNTFTARLLMLLEGRPILGGAVFQKALDDIITAYWRDYEDHKNNFVPAFFTNDVLRLWRTFCVNYEARTSNIPPTKNLKRRLKNYKLKHSRLLTCYSTLMCLTHTYSQFDTVSPKDLATICQMTPLERLNSLISDDRAASAHVELAKAVEQYTHFLEVTNEPEEMLLMKFNDAKMKAKLNQEAYAFAESIFEAFQAIGKGNKMHRVMLV